MAKEEKAKVKESKADKVAREREEQRQKMLEKVANALLKYEVKGNGGVVRAEKNKHNPL